MTIVPMYPLYSPGQICAAAFLGGPLAVAWLMAINYRRLGAPRKTIATIAVIAIALLALIWVETVSRIPIKLNLIVPIVLTTIQRALQGEAFRSHVERQGRVASSWRAIGVMVASLAVTVGIMLPFSGEVWQSSFKDGNCEILYADGATLDEARAMCKELVATHVIGTERVTVGIAHANDRAIVKLVLQDFALFDRDIGRELHALAGPFSTTVFHSRPVDIWLSNAQLEPKRKLIWEGRPDTSWQ